MRTIILTLVLLVPASAIADGFTVSDRLLAAHACAHEATWAGGEGGTNDCGALIQVVEARRSERETFRAALLRTMPRFAANRTGRAWVRALPAGPLLTTPVGWPYAYAARHDSERWHSVYRRVRGFMLGEEPMPCAEEPVRWFGRATDGNALTAALATGRWREAHCGDTRNAFLYAVHP